MYTRHYIHNYKCQRPGLAKNRNRTLSSKNTPCMSQGSNLGRLLFSKIFKNYSYPPGPKCTRIIDILTKKS